MKRIFSLISVFFLSTVLAGCGYNEIQTLDEGVKASWSETLNQYQRRADLVPQLVSSVNAYMVNEREVLTEVTNARSRVGSVQVSADKLPTGEELAQFQAAQGQLTSALSRLIAVSENYPQLKADALFRDLNVQLEGTENRIATARGRYIKEVQNYNTLIRTFPTLITAKIFGYDVKPNFGVENQAEIMRVPEVKFDTSPRANQPATVQ
ncbi:LemA family protein [Advenella alkanexedens]|jgi:LemA protein|uniref:LemA family protein n=1 Tax=Advenella alkanexedens TaxID=1481665 RepID=A0ABS6NLS0_9BURK|nr:MULTISPECIES: LemA family protein [Advenella]MBV4396576.1 LemA family protein [Advenella alkanexedens]MDD3758859.1 LemA family protein [Advenella sp.]NLN67755.1 LemA family protein [Alcaligenaceae bacterium]